MRRKKNKQIRNKQDTKEFEKGKIKKYPPPSTILASFGQRERGTGCLLVTALLKFISEF